MGGIGKILLVVAALAAVALIAWILAFGVESGVEERSRQSNPEPPDRSDDDPRLP